MPPASEQRWGVARGEHDGAIVIIRYNITAGECSGQSDFPIKLGFAIPLNRPNGTGLPDAEENAALGDIEEIIMRAVLSTTKGIYALALTTGTMKEFVYYIPPDVDIPTLHATVQSQVPTHEVQCMALEEPNWESYRAFTP